MVHVDEGILLCFLLLRFKVLRSMDDIDSRIDDGTFSLVIGLYAFLGVFRIRDEIVYLLCRSKIDLLHPSFYHSKHHLYQRIQYAKFHHIFILFRMTPIISRRSMAVAVVFCSNFAFHESCIFRFGRAR